MIRIICILIFVCVIGQKNLLLAQDVRLESEYKLAVDKEDVERLWEFITNSYARNNFEVGGMSLSGTPSVEIFIDSYFDGPDEILYNEEISLRHRKRFKDGELLKELVQLKTPYSSDKVIRNEIKFAVSRDSDANQLYSRHPLLQLLKEVEQERLAYHLAEYKLRPEETKEAIKLKQERRRVYISDNNGESVATITLDEVHNFGIPLESFAELELELNELRYTNAGKNERLSMTVLNDAMKSQLAENFPKLRVDQRSKYAKMHQLISGSIFSNVKENSMWLVFGLITSFSAFLFINDIIS